MITVTNYGPVRELRLNRPPVNALSTELISALRKAIEQAPVDGALTQIPPERRAIGKLSVTWRKQGDNRLISRVQATLEG
jgi:hypothetical protein